MKRSFLLAARLTISRPGEIPSAEAIVFKVTFR